MTTLSTNPTRAELLERKVQITTEIRALRNKLEKPGAVITQAESEKADDLIAERERIDVALEKRQTPSPGYNREIRIGQEERTYRGDEAVTGEPSFFRDLALSQVFRDPAATERLARHQHEMTVDGRPGTQQQRAIGTSAVVGLVPPAYLAEQYA